MTIGGIMQHPAIKAERIDLAYLPPSYYQQQQQIQLQLQQQQQQQQQMRMAPQTQHIAINQSIPQTTVHKQADTGAASVPKKVDPNVENQPDFQSIKGVFGWTVIDRVNIPYILRGDKQFVSVRIVEMKLLSRYPNSYPDDLGKQAPLTSFFITTNEAKLLNEINLQHCAGEYGKKEFTTKDLIVLLSDFIKFYNLVKKTFPDAVAAQQEAAETAGWLQIKNTVTPYIKRRDVKFVPLSVIQYAAGLLTNENVSGLPPTKKECDMLNEACKTAGVEFVFSDTTTRLIDVRDILKISSIDIIELPSSNPLKHATYMELPTTSSRTDTPKAATPPSQNSSRSGQPYMFQPGVPLDLIRTQFQGSMNRPEQNGSRFSMPPQTGFPTNQMFHPRMMDPRMAEMYRMQYRAVVPNGPPNVRHGQTSYNQLVPQMNPMMQYYMNMQNNQNMRNQSPVSQANKEMTQQHPVSNGPDTSPRTQSRPSSGSHPHSGSRPPSSSRPPSGSPLGSPLSPTGHSFPQMGRINTNTGYSPSADAMATTVPGQQPSLNGGPALQQMQNMFAQRFPMPTGMPNMPQSTQNQILSPQNQQIPTQMHRSFHPNANQEIPGLFSPTGSSVAPPNNAVSGRPSNESAAPPPPLQLMSSPPNTSVVKTASQAITSHQSEPNSAPPNVSVSQIPVTHGPVPINPPVGVTMPAPRNQPLPATISAAKPQVSLVKCIEGAWLNNKSISCLFLEQEDRNGRYCLVEAVCKLYFNGCSVNEFLFALENVLNVPLLTCNEMEEKAFIQYYSLPVVTLKCNKMIKFDDLEKYFPQLTYMFPSKEAIAQSESEIEQTDLTEAAELTVSHGVLIPEEIEASMPVTLTQMNTPVGEKRPGAILQIGSPSKRQRVEGAVDEDDDDDAIIILD